MDVEERLRELGHVLPDFARYGYCGKAFGPRGGHVPWRDGACFVACEHDFCDAHKVSSGVSAMLIEGFGEDRGPACRAAIGVQTLAGDICFETCMETEIL